MKKYVVRYAYATNLMEYLADAEPTLSIEDCGKLPLATVLTDGVAFNKIEFIDSPFSLDAENDGYLMHVEKTASGPALAFVDDVESVRALMAELGGGKLHLGLNADGVKTGRALLIMPYDEHKHTHAVSYISSGKLKEAVAKKKAASAKSAPDSKLAAKATPTAKGSDREACARFHQSFRRWRAWFRQVRPQGSRLRLRSEVIQPEPRAQRNRKPLPATASPRWLFLSTKIV